MITTKNKANKSNDDNKKVNKKLLIILLLIGLILALIGVAILLGIHFFGGGDNGNNPNKKTYQINNINPDILTDTTSLESDGSFIYQDTTSSDSYYLTITMKSNLNSGLGNYSTKDYIYTVYGSSSNTLSIYMDIYQKSDNQKIDKYMDIHITMDIGDKDNHHPLSSDSYSINKEEHLVRYSSSADILLYSISLSIDF